MLGAYSLAYLSVAKKKGYNIEIGGEFSYDADSK
jgi:hypothetical protein